MSLRHFSGKWFMIFSFFQKVYFFFSAKYNVCTALGLNSLASLNLFDKKMKRREFLFNHCGKRNNCGLIIEGLFEVYWKILDINFSYAFFEEERSEDIIYSFLYSQRDIS